jgi:hypothetical protein
MTLHRHLPEANRLSVLAAIILLSYALARFIDLPERDLSIQLPGVFLPLKLDILTAAALLVAGLTATGADWLLRQHPHAEGRGMIEHWLLPAMTALVIGIPLLQLPFGLSWLIGFIVGGALLMLVLLAEYITIDPDDYRQPLAAAGLIALSHSLLLILAVTLRFAGTRLYLMLPALSLAFALTSLRTLNLRLHGRWLPGYALTVSLICSQITAALHYLPISPTAYGLSITGPAYAATSLLGSLVTTNGSRRALLEPLVVLIVFLTAALWIG